MDLLSLAAKISMDNARCIHGVILSKLLVEKIILSACGKMDLLLLAATMSTDSVMWISGIYSISKDGEGICTYS